MNVFLNPYNHNEWEEYGRNHLLDLFLEHEYGFCPIKNEKLTYNISFQKDYRDFVMKKIVMEYKNHKMYFGLYLPKNNDKPLKTFLTIVHPYAERNGSFLDDYSSIEYFCPVKEIIKRGFAVALLSAKTVAEDVMNGDETGIFNFCEEHRNESSWGVIAAWAWACSKVLDYLVMNPEIDENKVAIIGHSRGGKTALLASAIDSRFYLTISNNSGNSGAALSRSNKGETIEDITKRFPYWFCKKYLSYAKKEELLPFDQHSLIGLIAPRYCYIASASDDWWADPDGELLSAKYATQYYEMYNVKGLIIPKKIELDTAYTDGRIAYHRRTGFHGLTEFDWQKYMDFFDRISG